MKQINMYTTSSCSSCKAMYPLLLEFCLANDIELNKIDAEINDVPSYVTSVPTTDYVEDGLVMNTITGPFNDFTSFIQ